MTLTFPTMAEQALAHHRATGRSLSTVARAMQAETTRQWPSTIIHTFNDDSTLTITGRGKNYSVIADLP